jgi:hypothetical protein
VKSPDLKSYAVVELSRWSVIPGIRLIGQELKRLYDVEDVFLVSVKSKQTITITPNLYRMWKRNNEFCIVGGALVVYAEHQQRGRMLDVRVTMLAC